MTTTIEPTQFQTLNALATSTTPILKGQRSVPENSVSRTIIIGEPGTRKTTSAASWTALSNVKQNVIFINFDNKLGHLRKLGFIEMDRIIDIPFHEKSFPYKIMGCPPFKGVAPNYVEAIPLWLDTQGNKLTPDHTLVIDSWTRMQDFFYDGQELDIKTSKKQGSEGEKDTRAFWGDVAVWNRKILNQITHLPCNVIVICHEQKERDEKGKLLDTIKAVQSGQTRDKIFGYFSNVFRQTIVPSKETPGEFVAVWQVKANAIFPAMCENSKLPMYVKADYRSLITSPNLPESIPTQVK